MTKFEELCILCGVAPESEEAKDIVTYVNELLFDKKIAYTDEAIFAAAIKRFRKPTIQTVYDFIIFFEADDEAQHRYVVASSEEEATEKLEAHYRELASQGLKAPCFISDPTVDNYCVIA